MSTLLSHRKIRSPLKWAGGKKRIIDDIKALLPVEKKKRLIEPFVGGGSVFLNTEFDAYLLVDMNHDLINLFNILKNQSVQFITQAEYYFQNQYNNAEHYYQFREEFNQSSDPFHRSLLFLYLNRHGYNGLCRYNKSGRYNVPFGQYKKPYFPKTELAFFTQKAQRAEFIQGDFQIAFTRASTDDVIYCDPPYSPINNTSNFTSYAGNTFGDSEQERLVHCAIKAKEAGITSLISNHNVPFTQKIYQQANQLSVLDVQRSISQKGNARIKVGELIALYHQ